MPKMAEKTSTLICTRRWWSGSGGQKSGPPELSSRAAFGPELRKESSRGDEEEGPRRGKNVKKLRKSGSSNLEPRRRRSSTLRIAPPPEGALAPAVRQRGRNELRAGVDELLLEAGLLAQPLSPLPRRGKRFGPLAARENHSWRFLQPLASGGRLQVPGPFRERPGMNHRPPGRGPCSDKIKKKRREKEDEE